MESESSSLGVGAALGRWWGQSPQPSPSTDVMNQLCRVCAEPAAGFHFGAFTCEGCKSFFGRTYNNLGSITECKNNGECVINKKNRTACKACRLKKCLLVGMSKSGSRYGRRSNWFKIHCLLQEQQQAGVHLKDKSAIALWGESYKNMTSSPNFDSDSKGSPTDESITLNNNNLSKDRERSPNPLLPSYSAEAAAALWAARHSLFPMQLPHHSMPSLPFIPPFANFPPPNHPQSQRNILLPFIQNLQTSPSPQPNHQNLTVSPSPSRSSEGSRSVCSQSPSPNINHPKNSSPSLDHMSSRPDKHSSAEKSPKNSDRHSSSVTNHSDKSLDSAGVPVIVDDDNDGTLGSSRKIAEEHSLAILRSLGPVQEQPMDLSVRVIELKNRRKSKISQRFTNDVDCKSEKSDDEEPETKDEIGNADEVAEEEEEAADMSDPMEANDENFNKRKDPLDLTKPAKLEI